MEDFNTFLDKKDIGENMVYRADRGRTELKKVMEENDLIDVWRERNKEKREYSRVQIVKDNVKQSRIDLLLANRNMVGSVKKVEYKRCNQSDHKFIMVKVDFKEMKRGPGTWHMNTEVLAQDAYKKQIEKLILENVKEIEKYKDYKVVWWDNLKYNIKKTTILFSKKIKQEKDKQEKQTRENLEEELKKVDSKTEDLNKIIELEEMVKKRRKNGKEP